jgi:hypothetical protein
MGGTKEGRTAALSIVAALAVTVGGPASAAADGPLDAGALQAVQQQAAAVVAPATQQAGATVQNATASVTPDVAPKPVPKPPAATAPATPAQAGVATASAGSSHHSEPASAKAGNPGPPPHGHEVMPAARSRPGRARVASSHSKLAMDTSAARGPVAGEPASGPPLERWNPRNPLVGLGRPVSNPATAIQLGWLLMLVVAGGIGARVLLRRLRAD